MTASIRKAGIIKPCCIGDAVMTLPAIDSIRQSPSPPQVDVWTGTHSRSVYEQHPGVAAIMDIPSVPAAPDLPKLVWKLRQSDVDGFIVLDQSRLMEIACRLAGVRILGSVRTPLAKNQHEIDKYLDAITQAGFQIATKRPRLRLDRETVESAMDRANAPAGQFVTLHPGGAENPGAEMHSKRWPTQRWIELVRWLDARNVGIVLTGSASERPLCEEVARGSNAIVAAGRLSLLESAAVASESRAFVAPDTGLAHLAAAVGASVIVIFGPTNPLQYAPRGEDVQILAASGAEQVEPTDLRRNVRAALPETSDVALSDVTSALIPRLALEGDGSC